MKLLSILFLVLSMFSAPSFSADVTSEPMQITKIMTTNGDAFIIFFDKEVSPSCHYNGTNSGTNS
ncbi:hypothetical protein, partial [Aliivibrio kagoshimensis]|uniref:hypothetical protein n=1 Tax=Aliivibrio kagoshimensis TaxID=2910230 RepID=UPI003D13FBDE